MSHGERDGLAGSDQPTPTWVTATPTSATLLVIDVQRVADPSGPWAQPYLPQVLPRIQRLLDAFGASSVLTRHRLVPGGPGEWARFAQRWAELDQDPDWWQLHPQLSVPVGATVADKSTYNAFDLPIVQQRVTAESGGGLVVAGCETDCCVVATLFAAVDAGVPVTLVDDACTGPDTQGHEAVVRAAQRLGVQVRVASTDAVVATREGR